MVFFLFWVAFPISFLTRPIHHTCPYSEMLAVVVVCEWSYLSWGQNVLKDGIVVRNNNFECYEWVDLHSGDYFESVICYLRDLLDKEGTRLSLEEKQACKTKFLETVQLEDDFFENAYN
jgi:thiaminase/transcriptional activator TenA